MSLRKASSAVLPTFTRYYATQRKVQSSMGIFEPFIDHKLEKQQQEQVMASTLISKLTVEDLLPDKDILALMIKHKKTALPIEKQQEITKLVLEHIQKGTDIKDQLLKLVDNKPSELSDFGNVLLTSSKFGAPVALELYKSAMDSGDDRGAYSYASMIHRGYRGIEKKEEQGIEIFSKLAQKGYPHAQKNLASIIMRTQPDKTESAIKLYELAGKQGLGDAYTDLGRMYRMGYGVHQDHNKAISYFKKGAELGNDKCNFMLGVYYGSGHADSDGQPDQKKAFKYFQKAAIKGMPEAQYNVGLRFLHGNGTEQNHFNAAEFFRMASMQNFQLAQINLATMYVEGRGVKKNLDEARQLFEKVAGKGGPIGKDAQKRIQEIDQAQGINQGGSKCVIM